MTLGNQSPDKKWFLDDINDGPTPMTILLFSRSLLTKGEKSESPLMMTKVSTWDLV